MPTYEYQCPEGHAFEKFQKMAEKPRAKCPVCGKMATRKISGGAGLVFKGTGFYITDYGKDGKGPRKEGAEKPAPSEREATEKPAASGPEGSEKLAASSREESAADAKRDTSSKSDTKSRAKTESKPGKAASGRGEGKASSE
jgi:putative FmdB family regulatory protein